MKFKLRIPSVGKESVEAAKRLLDAYSPESDEYLLASALIEVADGLELLNNDLRKSATSSDDRSPQ